MGGGGGNKKIEWPNFPLTYLRSGVLFFGERESVAVRESEVGRREEKQNDEQKGTQPKTWRGLPSERGHPEKKTEKKPAC